MKFKFLFFSALLIMTGPAFAQDFYQNVRGSWLQKAEASKPRLTGTLKKPVRLVTLEKDANAFQGWRTKDGLPLDSLYNRSFKKQSGVVIDFGEHLTGTFSFTVESLWGVPDAPLRFRITLGEVPAEMAVPFDPYPGSLSRAWLQDEVITVMELPVKITIPRRFGFRYVKIESLASSPYFDFHITDLGCLATTSATAAPQSLPASTDPAIVAIDKVGAATLKECMQTVYEDGPKRDRRLWIGDLYLESLANTYTFKNHDLTRRCLYLLAGLSREDGFLNSNVFETPAPHAQTGAPFLFDYSLLYNVALKEYLVASGDRETVVDLWPLAKKQMENIKKYLSADDIFDAKAAEAAHWWLFVDWKNGLDRQAALQGIIIYSMKNTYELGKLLGKEKEVEALPAMIKKLTAAARKVMLNNKTGLFESGDAKQISYASQAWMILADVATPAEGKKAMKALLASPEAVRPGSPYLYHYYVDALIHCGLGAEAKSELINYWGGMVNKGADTFWEVYDPKDEFLSPYNFYPINSYCHAWSCTPVYFIRKYPDIFQH